MSGGGALFPVELPIADWLEVVALLEEVDRSAFDPGRSAFLAARIREQAVDGRCSSRLRKPATEAVDVPCRLPAGHEGYCQSEDRRAWPRGPEPQ